MTVDGAYWVRYSQGYAEGHADGYQLGYSDGYADAMAATAPDPAEAEGPPDGQRQPTRG